MIDAAVVSMFGFSINLISVAIFLVMFGLLIMFLRIQFSQKLDFADMLTKDGKAVSLTKVLQLIGGVTATWVIIKLTLSAALSAEIFGIYLMYVASIEGYSKFIAAKYNYQEKSVKDAANSSNQ